MEALIPLIALVSLGVLAMRFGTDSRPTIRSDEHRLAATGVVWETEPPSSKPAAAENGPLVSHVVWSPSPAARSGGEASPFPTLLALDRAREPGHAPFATDPDAAFLEQRARHLIDNHWSERVWMTGLVDKARFDVVCDTLERDRQLLRRQRVDEDRLVDQPSSIAS